MLFLRACCQYLQFSIWLKGTILPSFSNFFIFLLLILWYLISSWKYSFAEGRYFITDSVLDEVTFGWPQKRSDFRLKENLALRLQRAINWVFFYLSSPTVVYMFLLLCFNYYYHDGFLYSFLSMTVGGIKWHSLGQRSSLSKWWLQAPPCLGNPIGKPK